MLGARRALRKRPAAFGSRGLRRAAASIARRRSAGSASLSRYPAAPASRARRIRSRSENEVRTTTATPGCAARILLVASIPSSTGISRSISTTSGSRSAQSDTASSPSAAAPTSSTPANVARSCVSPARTTAWSSATTTRITAPAPPARRRCPRPVQTDLEHPVHARRRSSRATGPRGPRRGPLALGLGEPGAVVDDLEAPGRLVSPPRPREMARPRVALDVLIASPAAR